MTYLIVLALLAAAAVGYTTYRVGWKATVGAFAAFGVAVVGAADQIKTAFSALLAAVGIGG